MLDILRRRRRRFLTGSCLFVSMMCVPCLCRLAAFYITQSSGRRLLLPTRLTACHTRDCACASSPSIRLRPSALRSLSLILSSHAAQPSTDSRPSQTQTVSIPLSPLTCFRQPPFRRPLTHAHLPHITKKKKKACLSHTTQRLKARRPSPG